MTVNVFSIGFTQTSAEDFFARLSRAGVKRVLDVRLNNTSQLAAFAKADDLKFFLRSLGGIDYVHLPILAPDEDMLREYKKLKGSWDVYEARFLSLMERRRVEEKVDTQMLDGACLLCSEAKPHFCHRRLVCEYLNKHFGGLLKVRHL